MKGALARLKPSMMMGGARDKSGASPTTSLAASVNSPFSRPSSGKTKGTAPDSPALALRRCSCAAYDSGTYAGLGTADCALPCGSPYADAPLDKTLHGLSR